MVDFDNAFIRGVFLNEIKNRFLCNVGINGKETICYIPSSCRLSNFLDLSGREVLLKPVAAKNSRTEFAVYAVRNKKNYILLNLSEANQIIEAQLHSRRFCFLGKRSRVQHERIIGSYKADLFIEDSNTVIEIKSSISPMTEAVFPTVYSDRAIQQLKEISTLLDNGYRACYIFVAMNPYCKQVRLNHSVSDFYEAFKECVHKGMQYRAFSVSFVDNKPQICSTIELVI